MIIKIIVCIIIPLLFFSMILKKEARLVTFFLCIGTIDCLVAYLLNTYIYNNNHMTYFYLTSTIAPMIEESLKFIPIFLVSLFSKKNRDILLPIGFAIGIGFAITENMYMLFENTSQANISWLFLRGVSTGLMHGMSASMIALGIYKSKEYPKLSIVGIIASLFLAIIYHGFYNCLVNNNGLMRYIGIITPLITYSIIFIIYKKEAIKTLIEGN